MLNSTSAVHKKCIVCNSPKIHDLKNFEEKGLYRCENCGMVFYKSIPTLEELEKIYSNYVYDKEVFVSPITIKRYNEILDGFEKYRVNNNLLDVGCGVGLFLEVAQKRGWKVFGTEYSDKAISICTEKGIKMKSGELKASDFEGIKFDIITSFEVIEHICIPQKEMENITGLLRPGGLFYCTTPNFNALSRYYLKTGYSVICPPEHLSFYTPATLKYLCKKMGLKPINVSATGISLNRLDNAKKSDDLIIRTGADTPDEKVRKAMEEKPILKLAKGLANALFDITGTGYALKGYFVKPE